MLCVIGEFRAQQLFNRRLNPRSFAVKSCLACDVLISEVYDTVEDFCQHSLLKKCQAFKGSVMTDNNLKYLNSPGQIFEKTSIAVKI